MSIEVGGNWGLNRVWRGIDERWHADCVGAKKKQGPTVMCLGMIGWQWKGPFYVWSSETEKEKEEAIREISRLNSEAAIEEARLNTHWKASEDWRTLREVELENARKQRQLEKNHGCAKKKNTTDLAGEKIQNSKDKTRRGQGN